MSPPLEESVKYKCPICFDAMILENSSLLSCGHVYHYNCLQDMYEHDWKNGLKSFCTICRDLIKNRPNRIYANFSKDPLAYTIPEDSVPPNSMGGKGDWFNERARVVKMEAAYEKQLHEMRTDVEKLKGEKLLLQVLADRCERLKSRQEAELTAVKAKLLKLSDERDSQSRLISQLQSELESYKNSRIAVEVERLAVEIDNLQSDAYFRCLLQEEDQVDRRGLVMMLAGMKMKNSELEAGKREMEKEIRIIKIQNERLEKRLKIKTNSENINSENIDSKSPFSFCKPITSNVDTNENSLDNDHYSNDTADIGYRNVTLANQGGPAPTSTTATSSSSSTMVPKIVPKGMKVPRNASTVTGGTGKRTKVIDLPNGQKILL